MKTTRLLGLTGIVFVSLSQLTWADPRGGGGHFGGGGHIGGGGGGGGFAGGGSRAAPAFYGGNFRTAPAFRGSGTYFIGRSVDGISRAPQFYYGGTRMAAVRPYGFARPLSRSTTAYAGRVAAANRQPSLVGSVATAARRQPNHVDSIAGRNRVSNQRTSTAANRQSFLRNHAFARHDANWHRDWDRHHAHFHNNRVFVFVNGFWWGLYPWDYYPYDANGYYPTDDYSYYPYDYSANPYDYYNYYPYSDEDQPAYVSSDQSAANATVSAVQAKLARLGYYNGEIDGTLGDQTEAALARYQEDSDLSVTGTVDAATLQSLGIR